jgi:hypothetical protein
VIFDLLLDAWIANDQTPSLPDAHPRPGHFRCGGRKSNLLADVRIFHNLGGRFAASPDRRIELPDIGPIGLKMSAADVNADGCPDLLVTRPPHTPSPRHAHSQLDPAPSKAIS